MSATSRPRDEREAAEHPAPGANDAITRSYARRAAVPGLTERYSALQPDVWQTLQERQRALLRLFKRLGWTDLAQRQVLEVGCGSGGNLLELLRLGFAPERLSGVELLPERAAQARHCLPAALRLHAGDALALQVEPNSQDAVFVSTVFSSVLDAAMQQRLADAMWAWVKPGGGVLWYDFTFNNPRNADVRGVPLARLRTLFPHGRVQSERVTLAPPVARAVTRVHAGLYRLFNALPLLRTHRLAWVGKAG